MSLDLRAERVNRGLSLRALAEATGVDTHALWRAERGGTPNPENAKRIADFYGVRVTDIWPVEPQASVAA